ncbi:hypothetical protein CCP3SC1AL1_4480002 [Gammaproteobacteria bacterium]
MGPFGGYREEIDIKVQLKATTIKPIDHGKSWSYALKGIHRYDDLRKPTVSTPRILVVLFLPSNSEDWLTLDDKGLVLRKCAYWVSLRNAKPSVNTTTQTVYLPKNHRFDPKGLSALMARLSNNDIPSYQELTE